VSVGRQVRQRQKNLKLFLAKGNNSSSSSRQTGAYSGVFARHGRLVDGVSNNCNPNIILETMQMQMQCQIMIL